MYWKKPSKFFCNPNSQLMKKKRRLLMWQFCITEASTLDFVYFLICASYNKIGYLYLFTLKLWNARPKRVTLDPFLCTYDYIRDIYVIDFIFILSHYIFICKSVINNYRFENMYAIFVIWVHCYIRLLYSGILVEKKLQRTLVRFSKKKIVENIDNSLCM